MKLVFLVTIFTLLGCDSRINFVIEDRKSEYFSLINNSEKIITFNFSLNGKKFYQQNSDILAEVNSDKKNFPLKLWEYLSFKFVHKRPLSGQEWQHSPTLFYNSLGFGYCDDAAAIFSHLVRGAGYNTRVWNIRGHVVSEVRVNNRWEMYDTDLGIYCFNNDGQVSGVEELSENPSLVTNPVNPVKKKDHEGYKQKWADFYSTKDNVVSSFYNYQLPVKPFNLVLPARSRLDFFQKFETGKFNLRGDQVHKEHYLNLRMTIPAGYKGVIEMPLVLHSIKGKGVVSFDFWGLQGPTTKKFTSISRSRDYLNLHREKLVTKINFIDSHSDIELIYFINPGLFKLEKNNTIKLNGEHVSSIELMVKEI
jgi:hypothetical protein